MRDEELCLCSRMRLLIFFSVRLNKKYIGQFSNALEFLSGIRHLLYNSALLIARIVLYFHIPALLDIHGVFTNVKQKIFTMFHVMVLQKKKTATVVR
jgi:hypothetical protein